MASLLVKNGIIATLGEPSHVLRGHSIVIKDGVIVQVEDHADLDIEVDQVIDASGKLVLPGFINAHMHFYSTLVRGLTKAQPSHNFHEILENMWWRLDKKLNEEDNYISALVVLINAIRHGTTTLIDHHASPFEIKGSLATIARAVKVAGLRACLSYEVSERDGKEITRYGIQENAEFIRQCQSQHDDQIKALFGLHASFTLSDEIMQHVSELCQQLNTGCHLHVAEGETDQHVTQEMCGERVVERLHRLGILGPQTIAAHCVHVNDREIDLLAETDTMMVHNPQSNMNNAVGIADLPKLAKAGVLTGLGTDAMTVNMLEELRVAVWAQHLRAQDPSVGFMESCHALVQNNAKIVGRLWTEVPIGVIAPGYAADIVLVDYDPPTPLDDASILGHLVFGVSQEIVDTTICRGEVLMRHKKLLIDVDEAELAAKSRELATALWKRF